MKSESGYSFAIASRPFWWFGKTGYFGYDDWSLRPERQLFWTLNNNHDNVDDDDDNLSLLQVWNLAPSGFYKVSSFALAHYCLDATTTTGYVP